MSVFVSPERAGAGRRRAWGLDPCRKGRLREDLAQWGSGALSGDCAPASLQMTHSPRWIFTLD